MTYLVLFAAAVVVLVGVSTLGRLVTIIVFEYERGLRFVRGRLRDEVGPGLYRYFRASTMIRKIDTRPIQLAVNGQEVLSRDGVAVKVSLSATYKVVDARAAVLNSADYVAALYAQLQQALRAAVSATDVETLLANRADLGPKILDDCRPLVAPLGLQLESLAIRDLTLPGELKKIFAQVVKARQEGLAALERARGETAALRNLANAAQMVQRNPHLFQLRLLQVAGQQTGTTIVVGMPQGTSALPLRQASDGEALPPETQGDESGS